MLTLFILAAFKLAAEITGPTNAELEKAALSTDWITNHDYYGQRYSDLEMITTGNVSKLKLVASVPLGENTASESNPLVYKGIMYVTTGHKVMALHASTGKVL
jgi:glucose dehydrogenase